MPKWGIEMIEGTISEWSVKEGDPVVKGQTIVLIETDKVVNEVEAEFDTKFVRITASAGEVCRVGALLAVMAQDEVSRAEVDAFVQARQRSTWPNYLSRCHAGIEAAACHRRTTGRVGSTDNGGCRDVLCIAGRCPPCGSPWNRFTPD